MGRIRDKMEQDLVLCGLSAATQERYLQYARLTRSARSRLSAVRRFVRNSTSATDGSRPRLQLHERWDPHARGNRSCDSSKM
jgi:hypothetical protein